MFPVLSGDVLFQILTQEDWNVVLFNGMEKTSHWAALYFVALMTFGNYVLFNLLVAILVEGFSSEVRIVQIELSSIKRLSCFIGMKNSNSLNCREMKGERGRRESWRSNVKKRRK